MHLFLSTPYPIASASLPWQLVLAFIVFNAVAGMISKRKQKQAKANSRTDADKTQARTDKDDARDAQIRRRSEEARVRAAAEAEKTAKAATAPARPGTPMPAGKGLLEQLARELGLELPQPTSVPVPPRAPAKPVEAQAMRPQTARQESRRDIRRAEKDEGSEVAVNRPMPSPMTAPVSAPAAQALAGPGDFTDPEALRKAFIMKVILDKPLALRRQR